MNFYNELLKKCIEFNKPFCAGKLGETECRNIINIIASKAITWTRDLEVNAGVFPLEANSVRDWAVEWISSISSLDLVLQWCEIDSVLIGAYSRGAIICDRFEDLDPFPHRNDGWHYCLADRTTCVVHPMIATIESQAHVFGEIWPGAKLGKLVCVKSPYPPALDPSSASGSYKDELARMKAEIDALNFDVCVIGAGAYSLPLCSHVKKLGRIAVHLGGSTQLLFGIRGGRWDSRIGSAWEGQQYYASSNYWRHPEKCDIPKNASLVEGGCYW